MCSVLDGFVLIDIQTRLDINVTCLHLSAGCVLKPGSVER